MERPAPSPPASRRRKAPAPAAALPSDDRFAPHPGQAIDAAYVMSRGFELIIARPWVVLGVMLVSLVVAGALVAALVGVRFADNALFAAVGIEHTTHPVAMLMLLVLGWSAALLLQAPLVGAAIEVHGARRGLHLEFLRRGLARLSDLVVAGVGMLAISAVTLAVGVLLQRLVVLATGVLPWEVAVVMLRFAGFLAITVMALRVVTTFALALPIIVVEQRTAVDALRRAWALGWPHSVPMLLAFLLPALVVQGLLFVLGFMPGPTPLVSNLVFGLGLALYQSVLMPVAYVAIREYVDGIDPARLASVGATR
jgi:hypothetical protein